MKKQAQELLAQLKREHPGRDLSALEELLPPEQADHRIQPVEWERPYGSPLSCRIAPHWMVAIEAPEGLAFLPPAEALDHADAVLRNAFHLLGVDARNRKGPSSHADARTVLRRLGDIRERRGEGEYEETTNDA